MYILKLTYFQLFQLFCLYIAVFILSYFQGQLFRYSANMSQLFCPVAVIWHAPEIMLLEMGVTIPQVVSCFCFLFCNWVHLTDESRLHATRMWPTRANSFGIRLPFGVGRCLIRVWAKMLRKPSMLPSSSTTHLDKIIHCRKWCQVTEFGRRKTAMPLIWVNFNQQVIFLHF